MQRRWQLQRTPCPSHLPPPAPKTQEQRRVGAANQPVSPQAKEWEGNNLVRATEGVKAASFQKQRAAWLLGACCHPRLHQAGPHSLYAWHCCVPGKLCHSDFIVSHSVAGF